MRNEIRTALCIIMLLPCGASAEPSALLKAISSVNYDTYFEEQLAGDGCKVDQSDWDSSLQFIANQANKIGLIPYKEYRDRHSLLVSKMDAQKAASSPEYLKEFEEASRAATEYGNMPRLFIVVSAVAAERGCVGTIEGTLSVKLAPTKILGTNVDVWHPTLEVWSYNHMVRGENRNFSNQVRQVGERLIKQLVNDWSASQDY